MGFLFVIAILIVVTVIPVMIAASVMGARNTGFWSCVIAVIGSVFASRIAEMYIHNHYASLAVSFVLTAMIFSLVLGAKFTQSALISILSVVIQALVASLVGGIAIKMAK